MPSQCAQGQLPTYTLSISLHLIHLKTMYPGKINSRDPSTYIPALFYPALLCSLLYSLSLTSYVLYFPLFASHPQFPFYFEAPPLAFTSDRPQLVICICWQHYLFLSLNVYSLFYPQTQFYTSGPYFILLRRSGSKAEQS